MFQQNITLGPGTGTYTQHTFEILIMLLGALLLGLWLGWILWGKFKQIADKLTLDNKSLSASVEALQAENAALKGRIAQSDSDHVDLTTQVQQLTLENQRLQDKVGQSETVLASTQARNRVVETELGLSHEPDAPAPVKDIPLEIEQPSVAEPELPEEVVLASDVASPVEEADLGGMSPVEHHVPQEAFTIVPPVASPVPVAELPVETGNKAVLTPPVVTDTVAPVPEPEPVVFAAGDPRDDLTVVEGIGPKIQELLYQYGIMTYTQLAGTEVARLREILGSAGPQLAMHDPGTWPSQANLAANDEWDNLKAIQKFLKGGKKPT
jgi:predicted flap endonuclease-1-like 5' DNA nuclease